MAYGQKYYAYWHSLSRSGVLYIDQNNYAGSSSQLVLREEGLVVSALWQEPLMGMNAEFEIRNTSNFFGLFDLLQGKDTEYRVRIVSGEQTLFEGFINTNISNVKYLHYQPVKFVASSYLSKLDNVHPLSLDTLQNITFLKVINEILCSTGSAFPISINTALHAEGDTLENGRTLFDKNGFFTELFWSDQVERETSIETLKNILTSFNCVLYWKNRCWYIERYEELWNQNKQYVTYQQTQITAGQAGDVAAVAQTIKDVHSLKFTEMTQEVSFTPGIKTLKINLDDQRLDNLTSDDFAKTVTAQSADTIPALRTWQISDARWDKKGEPFGVLKNSIQRRPGATWVDFPLNEGLSTSFRTTILAQDTTLNIKFGYVVENTFPNDTFKLEDYVFRFHYFLRDNQTMEFVTQQGQDEDVTYHMQYALSSLTHLQHIDIEGADIDKTTKSVDVEFSLPIGKVLTYSNGIQTGTLTGDHTFTLCLATVTMILADEVQEDAPNQWQVQWARFGDVVITETGDLQPNVVEGTFDENFLNKQEITLSLYDADSYSYKNAILRGTDLNIRTERWGITGGSGVINARGVCYSKTNNAPTLADAHTTDGTGVGKFDSFLSGLELNTTYYVRAYATDGSGNTTYGNMVSFTTLNTQVGSLYQGGIVAYIFKEGDHGYIAGETHGIIISVSDLHTGAPIGAISGGGPYTSDANRYYVGWGVENTEGILDNSFQSQFGIKHIAAYNARNAGGYNDWFLPTFDELVEIYKNRALLRMSKSFYWSSTEPPNRFLGTLVSEWKYAHAIDFSKNWTSFNPKADPFYWRKTHAFAIRAARYF